MTSDATTTVSHPAGASSHPLLQLTWQPVPHPDPAPSGPAGWCELGGEPADLATPGRAIDDGLPTPAVVVVRLRSTEHTRDVPAAARAAATAALGLLHAWRADPRLAGSRLVVATSGAVAVGPEDLVPDLVHAPVWGLLRAAQQEHPGTVTLVDLDPASDDLLATAVATGEPQLAGRDGRLYVPRIAPVPAGGLLPPPDAPDWRLSAAGELALTARPDRPLAAHEVRVSMRAAGLSPTDVHVAVGGMPGELGREGAGIVAETGREVTDLSPGDRVMGMFEPGACGPLAVAARDWVTAVPVGWSFVQAASVPLTFLTACHALVDLAGIGPGERMVLIGEAGTVGAATLAIARHLGAETHTAVEPRQPDLAAQLLAATGEAGFDVVVVPEAVLGELIDTVRRLLPGGGRVVALPSASAPPPPASGHSNGAVRHVVADLPAVPARRVGELLREVVRLLASGEIELPPVTTWPVARAAQALAHLHRNQAAGKVVLTVPAALDPRGTVLVTGGTGDLGAATARHLVTRYGVRHLLLVSRGGAGAPRAASLVEELAGCGARVRVEACDVADRDALAELLATIPAEHPLTAVVHAAGSALAGPAGDLDADRLGAALLPAVDAAWHLHDLTAALDLSAFVLYSSVAGTIGNPDLAATAAGGSFLDALAQWRRARGLPGTALAWGPWQAARGRQQPSCDELAEMSSIAALALLDRALMADLSGAVPAVLEPETLRRRAATGSLQPILRGLAPAAEPEPASVVEHLLAELVVAGIKLHLAGNDQIRVTAPAGRLTADLRQRISRHKPQLVSRLQRAATAQSVTAELPTIVPDRERLHEPFPASDLQTSFLMGSREGFEYYVRPHQYTELDFDELDPARFEAALNRALWRQRDNLVVARDDLTLQTIREWRPVTVTVADLRHLPAAEAEAALAETRRSMQRQEPPHDTWPWLAPMISRYGDGRSRLHYNNNNLFADAPSAGRLVADAMHYYHHPDRELPELEISYRDCVLALAQLEQSPLGEASRRYWADRIPDWPGSPEVPLVHGNEHRGRSRLSRRELFLPPELWSALRRRAAEQRGVTTTNVLLGGLAEVLAYWSGTRHFLLNHMITHRLALHPQMDSVLGNFASLYPLEVDWRPDEPFHARVRRLQATVLADVEHIYYSGVKVLQQLNQVRRTPGRAVCPYAVGSALFIGPAERPFHSTLETPQTLIDTEFWELHDGRLWVTWDVIEPMFPEGLIDAMHLGYQQVLTDLASSDQAWDRVAFDLLPASQRRRREALNRPAGPVPDELLHGGLPRQAAQRPAAAALVTADRTLTYADLHGAATRLAAQLVECGAGAGDLVAVLLPKGAAQVIAVSGVLAAGAGYVPIDPAWPVDRIRYLLRDTRAAAVVTDAAGRALVGPEPALPILAADCDERTDEPGTGEPKQSTPDDVAYVIYTSGSTGRPKGVTLDHRGPVNTIADINRRFAVTSDDVLLGLSSLCFDLSVYDVFGAQHAGATLVLPPGGDADPSGWLALARRHGVTVWNSVPALMQLAVEEAQAAGVRLPSLRLVLLSGDWIPVDLPDQVRAIAPQARVISLGGATEASIWSIYHEIGTVDPEWVSIPYGRPLANQSWHILDGHGRDVPTWVPGQLYIGGSGLSLGYLDDAERTAAAFVSHPRTGERLYRTGDLGRYLPNGDIEFLGRVDFQVKVQGFRVEPGEVEHALLAYPDVGQAAVVARGSVNGKQLVAFATGADGRRPDQAALRQRLTSELPSYLVPSQIVVLDRLPLTSNGKIDRRALETASSQPAAGTAPGIGSTAPRTEAEAALVGIWESVLDRSPVGVHDDFFDLGGHSFAALRVISRTSELMGRRLPLSVLLQQRTVAELAAWWGQPDEWSPLVTLSEAGARPPWFLVHPAGGNVLCYRELAGLLDHPSYGLQAPGPAVHRPALGTVDELADLYEQAVIGHQPRGPYLIGGWSSGAVIAAEVARRLEDRGEVVERLLVIDSPAPVAPRPVDEESILLWFLADLGFDISCVTGDSQRRLSTVPEPQRLELALATVRECGGPGPTVDPTDLAGPYAVFRGVVRGCQSHRARPVAADVTVVRAQDGDVAEFSGHPDTDRPDWGWRSLTSGRVETRSVSGTHYTLLTASHVAAVADAIRDRPRPVSDDAR